MVDPGNLAPDGPHLDEQVSVDAAGPPARRATDRSHRVIDATNLERNLYLFTSCRGLPVLVVLNMWTGRQPIHIDLSELESGCATIVTRSQSCRNQLARPAIRQVHQRPATTAPHYFPEEFETETDQLSHWLKQQGQALSRFDVQRLLLDIGGAHARQLGGLPQLGDLHHRIEASRQRLAGLGHRVPAVETRSRYQWIRQQLSDIYQRTQQPQHSLSDRIDRWLTHRVWDSPLCRGMFSSIRQLRCMTQAAGLIDERLIPGSARGGVEPGRESSAVCSPTGVIAAWGRDRLSADHSATVSFIAILEDCGYMLEPLRHGQLMSRLGLSGKSFLPR